MCQYFSDFFWQRMRTMWFSIVAVTLLFPSALLAVSIELPTFSASTNQLTIQCVDVDLGPFGTACYKDIKMQFQGGVFSLIALTGPISCDACSSSPVTGISLKVVNQTNITFDVLNVSPVEDETWGPNYLSEPLTPGQSFKLTDIPCDKSYDLRVMSQDQVIAQQDAVLFECSSQGKEWTISN